MSQLWPKAVFDCANGGSNPNADVSDICSSIYKACKGFGADEDALIAAMGSLDPVTRYHVSRRYEAEHGKPPAKLMKKECGGDFGAALELLARPVDEAEAAVLRKACKGAATNETLVYTTLCGRTNEEIVAIKKAYFRLYDKDLGAELASELGGDLGKLVMAVLQADEEEYDPDVHTEERAEEDAALFLKAGRDRMGTDEEGLFRLICRSPPQHLRNMNYKYVDRTGENLARSLKEELGGDAEDAAIHLVNMKLKPVQTALRLIESTMRGMGTDDYGLTVAVLRYQGLMSKIVPAYENEFGQSLEARVKQELRGDFERLMLEMIKADNVDLTSQSTSAVTTYSEGFAEGSIMTNGDAQIRSGFLRLTDLVHKKAGSAFTKVPFDPEKGFSIKASYRMHDPTDRGDPAADGLAVVLHRDPRGVKALGEPGGHLGCFGFGEGRIKPGLMMTLRSYPEGKMGVYASTDRGVDELGTESAMVRTNGSLAGQLWVTYSNGDLSFFVNNLGDDKGRGTHVTVPGVDLAGLFSESDSVYVGFTAATGGYSDCHDVMSWEFRSGCN